MAAAYYRRDCHLSHASCKTATARLAVATASERTAATNRPVRTAVQFCRRVPGWRIMPAEARMIFRQLYDSVSGTYTYVLASRRGGEALIIDPVLEKVERYLQLLQELDVRLVKAVDTHLHADHITGLGALRDRTHCITVMTNRRAPTS